MDNRFNSRQSFWEDELFHQIYDLVIVGGGLTGLSTAYFAKKENPDARIIVLERGIFPIGASTRNAGFACIGTVGEHLADLAIDSEDQLKRRISSRFEGLQLLTTTLGEETIDYDPCGGWEIFTDQTEFETACKHVQRFNGWMESIIGQKEVYTIGEFQGYPGIFNRVEGSLHPGKMIRRLIELNLKLGVEIRWQTQVSDVDSKKGTVRSVSGLTFEANQIVLATNAFTHQMNRNTGIKPGRGYVFITTPVPGLPWKGTFHFNKGYVYFRNLGADRLLIGGGRNVDYDAEGTEKFGINPTIKEYLIDFVDSVVKLPEDWEIEREWSGIMGFTESKSPSLERIGEKTWQVAGLSGMGVALGMAMGKSAASQVFSHSS